MYSEAFAEDEIEASNSILMKSSPGFVTSSKDTKSISAVDSLSIPSVINVLVVEVTEDEYQYSSIESVIKV